MTPEIEQFKGEVDSILADLIGFTSDDLADVDWYAFDETDPAAAAYQILEDEGYPVDCLELDASGLRVLV